MSEWISVKDQLPEDEKQYLIFVKGNPRVARFNLGKKIFKYGASMKISATHWMPLPPNPL